MQRASGLCFMMPPAWWRSSSNTMKVGMRPSAFNYIGEPCSRRRNRIPHCCVHSPSLLLCTIANYGILPGSQQPYYTDGACNVIALVGVMLLSKASFPTGKTSIFCSLLTIAFLLDVRLVLRLLCTRMAASSHLDNLNLCRSEAGALWGTVGSEKGAAHH